MQIVEFQGDALTGIKWSVLKERVKVAERPWVFGCDGIARPEMDPANAKSAPPPAPAPAAQPAKPQFAYERVRCSALTIEVPVGLEIENLETIL